MSALDNGDRGVAFEESARGTSASIGRSTDERSLPEGDWVWENHTASAWTWRGGRGWNSHGSGRRCRCGCGSGRRRVLAGCCAGQGQLLLPVHPAIEGGGRECEPERHGGGATASTASTSTSTGAGALRGPGSGWRCPQGQHPCPRQGSGSTAAKRNNDKTLQAPKTHRGANWGQLGR